MTSYRLYLVSGLTRRFEPAQDFEAPNDRRAIAIAEKLRADREAELWNGNQMVKDWKAGSVANQ
jgi:hypothetical protein